MRLSEFLRSSQEAVVAYSVAYAARIPALAGSGVTLDAIRDHLPLILDEIAHDLDQAQSREESIFKSHGSAPPAARSSAAQLHGTARAVSGLSIEQLVAEFRVLRSAVLRLWGEACAAGEFAAQDTLRFNEAIDQAVAESVAFFSAEVEHWRAQLLGVLGHDLRGPLNAVVLTAELLRHEASQTPLSGHAESIVRSAWRMGSLLDSLLEYNKASLGMGMTLHRAPGDLVQACRDELTLLRASLPGREISFVSEPACEMTVDFSRIREALSNLVHNAAQHGVAGCAVRVVLARGAGEVLLSVSNASEPIDAGTLQSLFEPLRQRTQHRSHRETRNLGLGLFIVREIARAHGGDATAQMLDAQVRFTVRLPAA